MSTADMPSANASSDLNARLRQFLNTPSNLVLATSFLILFAILAYVYFRISGQSFWRHDALIYLYDYRQKLLTEGRWLNYFAFSFLKAMPPLLSWYLFVSAWWALFYLVISDISKNRIFGALCACAIALNSGFMAQALWPSTMLFVPFIMLLVYGLTRDRFRFSVYAVGAILLFGSLSSAIFLFPILWFRHVKDWSLLRNAGVLVFWIAIFGIGALIARQSVPLIRADDMVIASWRIYNETENLGDILQNARYFWKEFLAHIQFMFPMTWLWLPAMAASLVATILISSSERKSEHADPMVWLKALFWASCVAFACHAQATALGIFVAYRTTWIMLPAILLLAAFVISRARLDTIWSILPVSVMSLLIALTGVNGFVQTRQTLDQFDEMKHIAEDVKSKITAEHGVDFSDYKTLIFYGARGAGSWGIHSESRSDMRHLGFDEGLSTHPQRWTKAFRETHKQDDRDCFFDDRAKGACPRILPDEQTLAAWECGEIYRGFCTNPFEHNDALIIRIPTRAERQP